MQDTESLAYIEPTALQTRLQTQEATGPAVSAHPDAESMQQKAEENLKVWKRCRVNT